MSGSSHLPEEPVTGTVVAAYPNRWQVFVAATEPLNVTDGDVVFETTLRGAVKKAQQADVLVGDCVQLEEVDWNTSTARICGVLPRSTQLSRPKMANVDQVLVVQSLVQPALDFTHLDRLLTHVALAGLPAVLLFTKTDLVTDLDLITIVNQVYGHQLGYSLACVSKEPCPLADSLSVVHGWLAGKRTVLAGESGVGKSTLLNRLNPQLALQVGEVSARAARGQHTTRHVQLVNVSKDDDVPAWVADTPGFSQLSFEGTEAAAIERTFGEFDAHRAQCEYPNCLHPPLVESEEGVVALTARCGVRDALEAGILAESRWASYQRLVMEGHAGKDDRRQRSQKSEYGAKFLQKKGGVSHQRVRLDEHLRGDSRRKARQAVQPGMGTVHEWTQEMDDDDF
ncbi:MAG: ribosome small subunit-dependent GTPase A [Vampirovibrionales bacterium]|nr:ribosome small subunit-dependent GTPase A [Vampirovibrionales bacterium]